ncbi:MAG: hypothetical protein PWP23_1975 [Candidatus Sumerlaeota bacterium]|nr:hypothetical protein [Candidatus Sumerlaeota bacterium]
MDARESMQIAPPSEEEAREIDAIFLRFGGGDSIPRIYEIINQQLNVIHMRAQSLIALGSVVITVTGFSGRIIADTNRYAQLLIVLGITLVGVAAGITLTRVMPLRWVTSYMDLEPRDWLLTALRRRTHKSRALRVALVFMTLGMISYLTSIAIMLMFPEATELTRIR